MEYFYAPPSNISPPRLTIDGDEFQHLTHVMRKEPGDEIRVVDGKGNVYDVRMIDTSRREAHCEITAHRYMENEPAISVTLAAGVLKNGARFDFLVEKATELGVRTIVPLATGRTIPQHAKTDRWQKLAIAAMKQSGRSVLPMVLPLTPFGQFISQTSAGANTPKASLREISPLQSLPPQSGPPPLKLIPHEKETGHSLKEMLATRPGHIVLCIGPEGGFSDEEVDDAVRAGFMPVSLGPRRLRTETASIAALTMVLS
jgi:16S rRNA (uracil1498-N3)-methyltransferase